MSFAQEIRDFLAAAQAGQKIFGAADDAEYKRARTRLMKIQGDKAEDPETDKLAKDQARARIAQTNASTALSNARLGTVAADTDYRRAVTNRLKALPIGGDDGGGIDLNAIKPVTPTQPKPELSNVGPQSSLDYDLLGDEQPQATNFAAAGGRIGHFAEGGIVDDEPETEPVDEENDEGGEGSALSASPAIPLGTSGLSGATDFSARSRTPSPGTFSHDAANDAIASGLKYGVNEIGRGGAIGDGRTARLRAYASGRGAMPVADMAAIKKAVDPEEKMGESERNLAALAAVYQFKMNKGDQVGAQRAAFMMLQHYRLASQRYAAIAHAAAEQGDIDGAAKAAMRAYANVPDGKDLKIARKGDKLEYSFVDEKTGQTITQGIATPQQLASAAMGVASGGFDQFLLQAAGQRTAGTTRQSASTGKAPTVSDRKNVREGVDAAIDEFVDAQTEKGAKIDQANIKALKNSSFHIASENPNLTPSEAFDAARTFITATNEQKPGDNPFEIEKGENGNVITFKDTGRSIMLSDAELRPLMVLRGKYLKELNTEQDKEQEKKKGKSWGEIGSNAGKAISNLGKEMGGAIGTMADAWVGGPARAAIPVLDNATWNARQAIKRGLERVGNQGQGAEPPL